MHQNFNGQYACWWSLRANPHTTPTSAFKHQQGHLKTAAEQLRLISQLNEKDRGIITGLC